MSDVSSEGDRCICRVCRFQLGLDLPYPAAGTGDLQSLRTQAQVMSVAIFRNWVSLNRTLKRYEDVLQKRWIKKNNAQRTKILLTAWPGMAATHRPDFAQLRDLAHKGCSRGFDVVKEREAHLWPFINQEDLVQPSNLLAFLHSRGRCLPCKFALGDKICVHAAKSTSKYEGVNEHRMLLHGKLTPRSYASLSSFTPGDRADVIGMHPTTGLLVLEIQERILAFLVSCSRLIMHDIDLDRVDVCPTKSSPPLIPNSPASWRTTTALTNEAPYRMPQQLDLERLCMLVEAKRSEAEEHIWSLREDPGYFTLQLQDWSEHTTEMVLDKHKMQHKTVGKPEFWSRACKACISHAYRNLIWLDELRLELTSLDKLHKDYQKHIHQSQPLPPRLEQGYQRLDRLVGDMRHSPLNEIVYGFPASPPLRNSFIRDVRTRTPSLHDLKMKPGLRGPSWRVNILFRTLLNQDQHTKHGLINIVGEIQRMLDEHGSDSEAITPWLASRFADLALVVEVRHQLDLFQPWSTMWRHDTDVELLDSDIETATMISNVVEDAINCVGIEVDPASFVYPSEKRRTEGTVIRMRDSEASLHLLWAKIDKHCAHHTGNTLHAFLFDFFYEPDRQLYRTPPWVDSKEGSIKHLGTNAEGECFKKYGSNRIVSQCLPADKPELSTIAVT